MVPSYRGKGIFAALVDEIYRRGWNRGYREVECSWTLEDNEAINSTIETVGAQIYKRSRIYEKSIG